MVSAGLLAWPLATEAQPRREVPRIGFLSPRAPGPDFRTDAFREGLRELGYAEGTTVLVDYRYAEGKPERLPELALELVRLKPDVIITSSAPGIRAVRNAAGNIPIVMAAVADPVAAGFVASLARPGGNVTGLSLLSTGIGGKRLEILKETIPTATRVGILRNAGNSFHQTMFKEMEPAAASLGLRLQGFEVRHANEIEGTFSALVKERVAALVVIEDPLWAVNRRELVEQAAKHRMPTMYVDRDFVQAGGLVSYGASAAALYRRAAVYVDKILKGAKPADLPVEQPTKFELAINVKTAKALGITIPPSLQLRADHIIE